ncbi:2-keto-3-deoxy-L-fuconate dehydrogenase [Novosphingobium sp. SG707]|nr:2-keto-3-deoxy-L-fuconate dehydrogenase [Novosphingobium sp. SG707]
MAMEGRLRGKTCLVTGGAQGIGRAIVERFAAEGARVIAADLRFDSAPPAGPRIETLVLNVTDEAAVAGAAAALGDVGVLVNCVGLVAHGTILDGAMEDFDRSMSVNVRSMALMIRAFLPAMLARGDGSIVNVASVVSSVMAAPNRFAYGTSKAAVIGLTMSVARDFIDRGIRCNAISPGTVETPSLRQRFAATGDAEAARAAFIARQPMGRMGQAEEIAATAVLLASDEARFMTGSNLVIDGGMSL